MATSAPASAKINAISRPMLRLPPVTSAFRPAIEKRAATSCALFAKSSSVHLPCALREAGSPKLTMSRLTRVQSCIGYSTNDVSLPDCHQPPPSVGPNTFVVSQICRVHRGGAAAVAIPIEDHPLASPL